MAQQLALAKPGETFYVSQIRDRRMRTLAGPFSTHAEAIAAVPDWKARACAADAFSDFDSFGTYQKIA